MSVERLRFSTAILRLLGEELNPFPDQGILELVKNAYDADATECTVELMETHLRGGRIRVRDDGAGMLPEEIRDGWLVVGESRKAERSPKGRLLVGSKGLGRLSALRLGTKATLISRPESQPTKEYSVVLDWKRFDKATIVENVEINVEERLREKDHANGTEILIAGLPFAWKSPDVRRLARAILLLTDPFGHVGPAASATVLRPAFHATLEAQEFSEIAKRAREGYWTECDFHLVATVDSEGKGSATVTNGAGEEIFRASHKDLADRGKERYCTPSATFELWEFLMDRRRFSTKAVKFGEVQGWLKVFGGVYLYHRGVRIAPYGDPGNDWLDMNLGRVKSPEQRPSTNNSIGRISVEDPKSLLQSKTDRLGFVENEAFRELIQFANDALDWMATERTRERDKRRHTQKREVQRKRTEAEAEIAKVVEQLAEPDKVKVNEAIQRLQAARTAEVELLHDETQLYHTLGTVGTTAAAFAHQADKPLRLIDTEADELDHLLGNPAGQGFPQFSRDCVRRIRRNANALLSFSRVTLRLLEHEKRRRSHLEIHSMIRETVELLRPYFELRQVKEDFEFYAGQLWVWGSRAALEAVITNLITNSLQAFVRGDLDQDDDSKAVEEVRRIIFRTKLVNTKIRLVVLDNGPGITGISVDDIWLPGRTTTERGTGLGLAIVKDVVSDLGGTIDVIGKGELGGAQFTIEIPAKNL